MRRATRLCAQLTFANSKNYNMGSFCCIYADASTDQTLAVTNLCDQTAFAIVASGTHLAVSRSGYCTVTRKMTLPD